MQQNAAKYTCGRWLILKKLFLRAKSGDRWCVFLFFSFSIFSQNSEKFFFHFQGPKKAGFPFSRIFRGRFFFWFFLGVSHFHGFKSLDNLKDFGRFFFGLFGFFWFHSFSRVPTVASLPEGPIFSKNPENPPFFTFTGTPYVYGERVPPFLGKSSFLGVQRPSHFHGPSEPFSRSGKRPFSRNAENRW